MVADRKKVAVGRKKIVVGRKKGFGQHSMQFFDASIQCYFLAAFQSRAAFGPRAALLCTTGLKQRY